MSAVPAATLGPSPRLKPKLQFSDVWLAEPWTPPVWLVDGWVQKGTRTLFYGPAKSGKTHIVGNLVRSLADGDKFLGSYDAVPLSHGTIVMLDFEMPENQLRQWYADQCVKNLKRVAVCSIRGFTRHFNLKDPGCHNEWVQQLRGVQCKFLVLDCASPILTACGFNESANPDVQAFWMLLDELMQKADIENLTLVHHTGHEGKNARGGSAMKGTCDAEIVLVRKGDESTGQRYLHAVGRDVSQTDIPIYFDAPSRRFSTTPSSLTAIPPTSVGQMKAQKPKAHERVLPDILELLAPPQPPKDAATLISELKGAGWVGHSNTVYDSLKLGVKTGVLKQVGPGNHKLYTSTSTP